MSSPIIGIPTTRVSDLFVRQRLMNQVQYDQSEMYRVQMQLSTGRRFQAPSEDPVAALRIISLQRLLERKAQVASNINTNKSYLGATDVALSNVSSLLAEVRGAALGVLGTTSSDVQRASAAQQVDQVLRQLLDIGNQKFRGRYLFAGSSTAVRPFETLPAGYVQYCGNEARLSSFADIDLLFETNLNGSEIFGAISQTMCGTVNLAPVLGFNTRLADLRNGQGISPGSIAISDGSKTSIIDISKAETLGDLAAIIQTNPPEGRSLTVEITTTGLVIRLDSAKGNLSIREVGGGTTADELGILKEIGVGNNPIVGRNLEPILRKTTSLQDVFQPAQPGSTTGQIGSRARTFIHCANADNDLILEADVRGEKTAAGFDLNDVTVSFVNDDAVVWGNEWIDYDPAAKTVVVHIDEGYTKAYHVVAKINEYQEQGLLPFTARLNPLDDVNGGKGLIDVGASGKTSGGTGEEFDQKSGLRITNGGKTYDISLVTAKTVEDVLNIINGSGAGVLAELNATKTGINIRSRTSGNDFMIGENGGKTATQLGLRSFAGNTLLSSLNYGRGVADFVGYTPATAEATFLSAGENNDLIFRAKQSGDAWNGFAISFVDTPGAPSLSYDPVGKTMQFSINSGSTTANEVIGLLLNHPAASADFEAVLAPNGDGSTNTGIGTVGIGSVTTAGGDAAGTDFTITRADGATIAVDVAGARTVADVLALINDSAQNTGGLLLARLAKYGNGIELLDQSLGPGALQVRRDPMSTAAIDLGLVPADADAGPAGKYNNTVTLVLPGLNNDLIFTGQDPSSDTAGVRIVLDGSTSGVAYNETARTLTIGFTPGETTALDVIAALEQSAAAAIFKAALDPADGTPNDGSGMVAEASGVMAPMTGGEQVLTACDVNPLETESVFTALLRLCKGLESNNVYEIQRAIELLDRKSLDLTFMRAELGARQQAVDVTSRRLDTEEIELKQILSIELDADLAAVISDLVARQTAFEASLRTTAQVFGMTLLNYL